MRLQVAVLGRTPTTHPGQVSHHGPLVTMLGCLIRVTDLAQRATFDG
jgi:hypothetical protein